MEYIFFMGGIVYFILFIIGMVLAAIAYLIVGTIVLSSLVVKEIKNNIR